MLQHNGHSWTESLLNAIDSKTKVISIPQVHWTDGRMIDLEIIGNICQQKSIYLVLDVTQSLGANPLNIDKITT